MTYFIDGPAEGVKLNLTRTPVMLRVVYDGGSVPGVWDALSELDDEAKDTEAITVYRITNPPAFVHIDGIDKATGRRFGRTEYMATYKMHKDQPGDAVARDNAAWREWCSRLQRDVVGDAVMPEVSK